MTGSILHILEATADRWRVVVDAAPARRRLFEAFVPKDATVAELEDFHRQLVSILTRRRASDQEITKKERP